MASNSEQDSDKTRIKELEASLQEARAELAYYREIAQAYNDVKLSLEESESRFKCLAEAGFEGLALHQNGIIIEVNDTLVKMSGYSRSELIGMMALQLIAPEYWVTVQEKINDGFEEPYQTIGIKKDGTRLEVELQGKNSLYQGIPIRVVAIKDITIQQSAKRKCILIEEELRQSELRFKKSFEATNIGICFIAPDHKYLAINPALCQMLGYTEAELMQLSFLEITYADDLASDLELNQELLNGEINNFNIEKRYIHKNGNLIWVSVNVSHISDANQKLLYSVSIVQNICDRKLIEAELVESEAKQKALISALPDLIIIVNREGIYLDIIHTNGYKVIASKNTLVGLGISSFLSAELAQRRMEAIENVLQTGLMQIYEQEIEVDGKLQTEEVRVVAYRENEVLILVRDISDQQAAIQELKQSQIDLAEEVSRRRTLFDNSIDGIVILDRSGNIIEANVSFANMLGYEMPEMTNLNLVDFDALWMESEMKQQREQFQPFCTSFETRHRRKDGSTYDVEISSNSVNWNGQIVEFCICRDISDRKACQISLKASESLLNDTQRLAKIGGWYFDIANDDLRWTQEVYRIYEIPTSSLSIVNPLRPESLDFIASFYTFHGGKLIKEAFIRAVEYGESFDLELPFITATGKNLWVRNTATAIKENEKVKGVIGNIMDITERKKTEVSLKKANQKLTQLASLDYLTQVANRRCFDEYLELQWSMLRRDSQYLSIIMCDIDCFKFYNDGYGHQAGDDCLKKVAQAIAKSVKRPADLVSRYGGEEFSIILPNTNIKGAKHVAESIRAAVKDLAIVHEFSNVEKYVTLSLGVSSMLPDPTVTASVLVGFADHALYQAKQDGRDRIYSIG